MAARLTAGPRTLRGLARGLVAAALAAATFPAAAEPAPCGVVVLASGLGEANPTAATGLNPLIGSSLYNSELYKILYRPLVWIDKAGHFDPAMSMASKIDVSDDGLTFHVTLGGWNWSDGAPVVADDVAYCLELIRQMGQTWAGIGTVEMPDIIKALTVTGPKTFDIELAHKISRDGFLIDGLSMLYPLPRHVWRDATTDQMWRRQTDLSFFDVVDGPYKAAEFKLGRYVVLEANPAYSGAAKPTVQRVVVNFLEGVDELRALESGDVDASNIPHTVWDAAIKLPGLKRVPLEPAYGFDYLGLNHENPEVAFFNDLRVRQAMADAIDFREIIDLVYHGQASDARGPVPAILTDQLSEDAKAGRIPVGYDPARARALLDAAGWAPGADGVRQKDGVRLAFNVLVPSGRDVQALRAQVVQRNLAAVGVQMSIEELAFTQMLPIIYGPKPGWQAYQLGWSMPAWPNAQPLFGTGGSDNTGAYSDPKMDAIASRVALEDGPQAARDFNDYAIEQQPVIFLPRPSYSLLSRPGIEGWQEFINPDGSLWAPERLRLTGERACDADPRKPS